jgi:hypothetical protein
MGADEKLTGEAVRDANDLVALRNIPFSRGGRRQVNERAWEAPSRPTRLTRPLASVREFQWYTCLRHDD